MLLRAEMEVSGVLAVASASNAIHIDPHNGFKIMKTKIFFFCSFHLPDYNEQQLSVPFTVMPPLYYVLTTGEKPCRG